MWVLTEEYNDYNQNGAYFLAVFAEKPTPAALEKELVKAGQMTNLDEHRSKLSDSQIAFHLEERAKFVCHVLKGGGRIGTEYCWVNLEEVTPAAHA